MPFTPRQIFHLFKLLQVLNYPWVAFLFDFCLDEHAAFDASITTHDAVERTLFNSETASNIPDIQDVPLWYINDRIYFS